MNSHCFKISKFHVICHMLAKFSGFNSKGPYPTLEKEKKTICVEFTYSVKRAREIRTEVSCRSRATTTKKCTKKAWRNEQSCCFANLNLSVFGFLFLFCFVLFCFFFSFFFLFFFFFFFFCRSRYCRRSCCLISALLLSRNLATMVTWRHTSPLYWTVKKKESPSS